MRQPRAPSVRALVLAAAVVVAAVVVAIELGGAHRQEDAASSPAVATARETDRGEPAASSAAPASPAEPVSRRESDPRETRPPLSGDLRILTAPVAPKRPDPPCATLKLTIVKSASGEPCDRALVRTDLEGGAASTSPARADRNAAITATYCDARGHVELKLLANAPLVVEVDPLRTGSRSVRRSIGPFEPETTAELTIEVDVPGGRDRFLLVRDADDRAPIGGARCLDGKTALAVTNSDGRARLECLHQHDVPFLVSAEGHVTRRVAWDELTGSTEEAPGVVTLARSGVLVVTLLDATGAPAERRTIRVEPDPSARAFDGRARAAASADARRADDASVITDESGRATFPALPARVALALAVDSRRAPFPRFGGHGQPVVWTPQAPAEVAPADALRFVLAAGELRRITLTLLPTASISGRVFGGAGPTSVKVCGTDLQVWADIDAEGRFLAEELPAGAIDLLAYAGRGRRCIAVATVELAPGETRTGIELRGAASRVSGRVVSASGPAPSVQVELWTRRGLVLLDYVASDAAGAFAFEAPSGALKLRAVDLRGRGELDFDAPCAAPLELVLAPFDAADGARVAGTLALPDAEAATAVVTALRHDATDLAPDVASLVRIGSPFSFKTPAPGTWDLVFTCGERVAVRPSVATSAGATADLGAVALSTGAVLELSVATDPAERTAARADDFVVLVRSGETRLALVALARGESDRLVLPPVRVTLDVRRRGVPCDSRDLGLAAGTATTVELGGR